MDDLLVFDEYCQLIDGIQYFHDEQTELRFLTSKILLGTFTIVGAIFFTQIQVAHVQNLIIAAVIPILSIGVITVNLAQDLIVKERLRLACLSEALKLEKKNEWLPPFHRLMIHHQSKKYHGSGHKKLAYYLGCILILSILSAVALAFTPIFSNWISIASIFLSYTIFVIFYIIIAHKLVRKGHDILKELDDE